MSPASSEVSRPLDLTYARQEGRCVREVAPRGAPPVGALEADPFMDSFALEQWVEFIDLSGRLFPVPFACSARNFDALGG
jgi:hypothetical protein